jgi:hypothetical protein
MVTYVTAATFALLTMPQTQIYVRTLSKRWYSLSIIMDWTLLEDMHAFQISTFSWINVVFFRKLSLVLRINTFLTAYIWCWLLCCLWNGVLILASLQTQCAVHCKKGLINSASWNIAFLSSLFPLLFHVAQYSDWGSIHILVNPDRSSVEVVTFHFTSHHALQGVVTQLTGSEKCRKPLLIQLPRYQIIWIKVWKMKHAFHSWVHTSKDTLHLGRLICLFGQNLSFSKPLLLCLKTSHLLNKCTVFIVLNEGSTVFFISSTLIIKLFVYLLFLSFRATFCCFTNSDYCFIQVTSASSNYSRLARVYCIFYELIESGVYWVITQLQVPTQQMTEFQLFQNLIELKEIFFI